MAYFQVHVLYNAERYEADVIVNQMRARGFEDHPGIGVDKVWLFTFPVTKQRPV